MICELEHKIFTIEDTGFEAFALDIFKFQYGQNPAYREYVDLMGINPYTITSLAAIPFLPVEFFKSHRISTTLSQHETVFESSGTTQTTPGRHYIKDLSLYKRSFQKGFERNYGRIKDWCIIGLLPSYLERTNSSLVTMVHELITISEHSQSGFYLYDYEKLSNILEQLEGQKQKTFLIGVTFGLIDFAEKHPQPLQYTTVVETGGMKGRKDEMTREEVHGILKNAWSLPFIHSEYGMTELLSQAYSPGEGIFGCPPWMRVMLRDDDDPLCKKTAGRGLINVVDLANIYSCSFIATDDVGFIHRDRKFEVLGRRDNSDLRGCSLMAANL